MESLVKNTEWLNTRVCESKVEEARVRYLSVYGRYTPRAFELSRCATSDYVILVVNKVTNLETIGTTEICQAILLILFLTFH